MTGPSDTTPTSDRSGSSLGGVTRWDILRVLQILVFVAILLPFVVYAVPQVAGAEHSYVVLSGSMEPEISPGDVIIVEDVSASDIEEGDVITFVTTANEPPTTHRVVDTDRVEGERVFWTKGDANENVDASPVAASNVIGKVLEVPLPTGGTALFVLPYIGFVVEFAGTSIGFVALVILPFSLLVISELWSYALAPHDSAEESATAPGSSVARVSDSKAAEQTADQSGIAVDSRLLYVFATVLAVAGTIVGRRAVSAEDPVLAAAGAAGVAGGLVLGVLLLSHWTSTDADGETPAASEIGGTRADSRLGDRDPTSLRGGIDQSGDAWTTPADDVTVDSPLKIPADDSSIIADGLVEEFHFVTEVPTTMSRTAVAGRAIVDDEAPEGTESSEAPEGAGPTKPTDSTATDSTATDSMAVAANEVSDDDDP